MKITEEIKKIYPKYEDKKIAEEIKIFEKIISEISNETNLEVKNLTFETIEDSLKEKLPSFSDYALKVLFDNFEEKTEEEKLESEIEKIINKKPSFNLIKGSYSKDKKNVYEFIKTANSFGIGSDLNEDSYDLENLLEDEISKKNHLKNYKEYIGQKLLLTKNEIENSKIEELDGKMFVSITLAKEHIFKVLKNFNGEVENFKSVYFEQIHEQKNIFGLMKFYFSLERKKKIIFEKINNGEKKSNFENALRDIEIGKFEIQRIFALNSLYIDRNGTLNHKHVEEEKDFLISKIKQIGSKEIQKGFIENGVKADNELYSYTKKHNIFWKKDENGKYSFSENEKEGFQKISLDYYEIEGRFRNYEKNKQKIRIYHIGNRTSKNAFSTVEKFLRKGLSSFNEILDHKGFIFVVNNYKKDGKNLLKILENELGTLRTSWVEEPVFMAENGNENSNSEYNSLKGILKISYKGKKINDFFNFLGDNKIIKENKGFFHIFKDLKNKFFNKKYFIETEIQIFDLENYLKAEIDETSPAYHGNYKEYQQISNIPLYFPKDIYGEENLKKVIKNSLEKIKKS